MLGSSVEWKVRLRRFVTWSRTPPFLLLFLWCLAVQVTVVAFVLSRTYTDATLVYTLGLASATAVAGTDIALWVQAYYSRLAQDRQFRGDLEVRYFEEIYGPLYEDSRKVVDAIEAYSPVPWLEQWGAIERSRFAPFVDAGIRDGLIALDARIDGYRTSSLGARQVAQTLARAAFNSDRQFLYFEEGPRWAIADMLVTDARFVFDPADEQPHADYDRALWGIIESYNQRPLVKGTREDLNRAIRAVKQSLVADGIVKGFTDTRNRTLEEATKMRDRIERRMRSPFEQTN